MINQICTLTAQELIEAFQKKKLSPVEVMEAVLIQAETLNPHINALFGSAPDRALALAYESEQRWGKNQPKGILDGLPLTVKDSIKATGFPSWHGCKANMQSPLDTEDSPPAARLKESGAIIFAKTAMSDIGMLASGVSSAHGITRNPWNTDFNPGGSSSGAAAAVAAGIGPCSIGTDGGGSVRLPAAHCGLFGFKPTNGRIPHLPTDPVRSAGPLTRSVADGALLMNVLTRPDSRDFGSLPPVQTTYHKKLERGLQGVRLGLLLNMGFGPSASDEVIQAVQKAAGVFEEAGAVVEPVSLTFGFNPLTAIERYFMVRTFLEFNTLAEPQKEQVLPYIQQWVAGASAVSGVELMTTMSIIEQTKAILTAQFEKQDYILSPVMPDVGFPAESLGADNANPIDHIGFAGLYNQTGQPAASIGCGFAENGLPIGLQIIGKRFDDLGVLQLSYAYEQRREFDISWPMISA